MVASGEGLGVQHSPFGKGLEYLKQLLGGDVGVYSEALKHSCEIVLFVSERFHCPREDGLHVVGLQHASEQVCAIIPHRGSEEVKDGAVVRRSAPRITELLCLGRKSL